jgi:hypothetical protein
LKLYKYISILSVTFLLQVNHTLYAQNTFVKVQADPLLDSLIERNIETNKSANGIQGYRVQIFFGSERKAAQDAKTKFLQMMPDEEVYLIYQQPYFKVRVGDYRTKLEAEAVYRKVLPDFEKVFIIPDKINLPKL